MNSIWDNPTHLHPYSPEKPYCAWFQVERDNVIDEAELSVCSEEVKVNRFY